MHMRMCTRDRGWCVSYVHAWQGVVRKLVTRLDVGLLRTILTSYYATVQRALSNSAPKAIMCFLVRGTQERRSQ